MTILTQILQILPRAIGGALLFSVVVGGAYLLGDWIQYRRLIKIYNDHNVMEERHK